MARTHFKEHPEPVNRVICDTNIWYEFALDKIEADKKFAYIPTGYTIVELGMSKMMANDLPLYQKVVQSIYDIGGPIIPVNPYDYILHKNDPNYPFDDKVVKDLLHGFSMVMSMKLDDSNPITPDLADGIKKRSDELSAPFREFADWSNDELEKIRKNINTSTGKKKHKAADTSQLMKDMLQSFLNHYSSVVGYDVDWDKFDWSLVELFLAVSDHYFQHLETTKGMKVDQNDAVDWLNMLYVQPGDMYYTMEKQWRRYIQEDDKIGHYLYQS